MDDLADQAGASHWATRTEALERMLHLLTVEGGDSGDFGVAGAEGGHFVLESRPASRRLETVIAERVKDVNFRVVAAALKLLGGLVAAHPVLMASHASALLPAVSSIGTYRSTVVLEFVPWSTSCAWRARGGGSGNKLPALFTAVGRTAQPARVLFASNACCCH